METDDTYYYFAPKDRRLRHGDGRKIERGVTHSVEPPLELCEHGLHASRQAIDALQYAPGPTVCIVELGGEILHGGDKACATERTYREVIDGEDLLREFARRCALDVIDLWDAPDVVREYLETGDEDLREAVWAAVRAAVRAAARAAAWATARATARDAARVAIRAARASREASRVAARVGQNKRLERMITTKIKERCDG